MYLKQLKLFHFKNHTEAEFAFSEEINCFTGPNGSGKTNVLDAIHYLSLSKSYFSNTDSLNIQEGQHYFTIHGVFDLDGYEEAIYCGLKQGQKKIVKRNQKEYQRIADHIGLIPIVMIAPGDQELINGSSEVRRKFLDSIICQVNRDYLQNLTAYQRVLQQRNALLKQLAASRSSDTGTLEILDEQLNAYASPIYQSRKLFLEEFKLLFNHYYQIITDGQEDASVLYESQLEQGDLISLLHRHSHRDKLLQHTTAGIHKDDLEFLIGGKSVRRFGSQGQQKSFVVSLKLAQFEYIKQLTHKRPLLLLDDIFEKLDDMRMERLLALVSAETFGQLFVTDTHKGRAEAVFGKLNKQVTAYHF